MKLTPTQILAHLGLNVPAEGIEINSDDAYYYVSALELIGKTMSADSISSEALNSRHTSLIGLRHELASIAPGDAIKGAEQSRASLRVVLKQSYGLSV